MNVLVVGDGPLADATRNCCEKHFDAWVNFMCGDVIWLCDQEIWVGTPSAIVVVSHPHPPGTIAALEKRHPRHTFAYSPENVRLASAEQDFLNQARIICGVRKPDARLDALFAPFTDNLIYTSIETAEMVKHALNGFLAVSVAYANELGELCKKTGADMAQVTQALRSDPRIGKWAYLDAGKPYGSHLEREINNLMSIGETPLIAATKRSNDEAGRH